MLIIKDHTHIQMENHKELLDSITRRQRELQKVANDALHELHQIQRIYHALISSREFERIDNKKEVYFGVAISENKDNGNIGIWREDENGLFVCANFPNRKVTKENLMEDIKNGHIIKIYDKWT